MRIRAFLLLGSILPLTACLSTVTSGTSIETSSSVGAGTGSTGTTTSAGTTTSGDTGVAVGSTSAGGSTTGTSSAGSTGGSAYEVRVSTVAGGGTFGFQDGPGGRGGGALFGLVAGLAFDSVGNLYVADRSNAAVRKIDPSGNVTTVVGNGNYGDINGQGGRNGPAEMGEPYGLVVDPQGNVLVADFYNHDIRSIAPGGEVSTLSVIEVDGVPFGALSDIAIEVDGSLDVTDFGNSRVCRIDTNRDAGFTLDPVPQYPYTAGLTHPLALTLNPEVDVYVSDDTEVIRLLTDGGTDVLAGNRTAGFADGSGGPDGGAEFQSLGQMALDGDGNLIVADSFNNRIRKIDREGNVTTIAGTGESGDADGYGGPDGGATFAWPFGLAIDDAGSIYVADTENFAIRKITFYKP